MAWSDSNKNRFYDEVIIAVQSGVSPRDIIIELKIGYFIALDAMRKQAEWEFNQLLKNL